MTKAEWMCQECGRKFKTVRAAERASSEGCPRCGGCDIDLAPLVDDLPPPAPKPARHYGPFEID